MHGNDYLCAIHLYFSLAIVAKVSLSSIVGCSSFNHARSCISKLTVIVVSVMFKLVECMSLQKRLIIQKYLHPGKN